MATANPHFDVQQQALISLKRIHSVCLKLEALQVVASFVAILIGSLVPALHLYGVTLYFLTAVFAHIVVYYVLTTIGRNVRESYINHPDNVQEWLVFATGKLSRKVLPFIALHGLVLVGLVCAAFASTATGQKLSGQAAGSWFAVVLGMACYVRIRLALRANSDYLVTFVKADLQPERSAQDEF